MSAPMPFVYRVADSGGLTDTATVTVTMVPRHRGDRNVVFDDLNRNGQRMWVNPASPVTVARSGGPNASTASDGTYRFGDVPVGAHRQIAVPPAHGLGPTSRTVVCLPVAPPKLTCAQAQGVIQGVVFDDLSAKQGAGPWRTRHCRRNHHPRRH